MDFDRKSFLVNSIMACAKEIYNNADSIIGNEDIFGRYEIKITIGNDVLPTISINRTLVPFTFIPNEIISQNIPN